jgi:hypothetical protein
MSAFQRAQKLFQQLEQQQQDDQKPSQLLRKGSLNRSEDKLPGRSQSAESLQRKSAAFASWVKFDESLSDGSSPPMKDPFQGISGTIQQALPSTETSASSLKRPSTSSNNSIAVTSSTSVGAAMVENPFRSLPSGDSQAVAVVPSLPSGGHRDDPFERIQRGEFDDPYSSDSSDGEHSPLRKSSDSGPFRDPFSGAQGSRNSSMSSERLYLVVTQAI